MSDYKSEVKTVYASQEVVYKTLSDLNNLSVIQRNIDNPLLREQALKQSDRKVTPEQFETIVEKIRSMQFDTDSISVDAGMMGNIALHIIEREEPKCVKFELEGAPIQANLWIQLLPATDCQCAMRVTVRAELNFFIKQMIGSKLQQGVDGFAQLLAGIPYNQFQQM